MLQHVPLVNCRGGKVLNPNDVVGTIAIENVDFFYPTKPDVQVAKKVNIVIEKNTTVAFVG